MRYAIFTATILFKVEASTPIGYHRVLKRFASFIKAFAETHRCKPDWNYFGGSDGLNGHVTFTAVDVNDVLWAAREFEAAMLSKKSPLISKKVSLREHSPRGG